MHGKIKVQLESCSNSSQIDDPFGRKKLGLSFQGVSNYIMVSFIM
jgi:hypothetical protein